MAKFYPSAILGFMIFISSGIANLNLAQASSEGLAGQGPGKCKTEAGLAMQLPLLQQAYACLKGETEVNLGMNQRLFSGGIVKDDFESAMDPLAKLVQGYFRSLARHIPSHAALKELLNTYYKTHVRFDALKQEAASKIQRRT